MERKQVKAYIAPSVRVMDIDFPDNILSGNIEPIEGGDDPDLDW